MVHLSKKEIKVLSVLLGWFIVNCIFYINYQDIYAHEFFWPIDDESVLAYHYDSMEFIVYGVMPLSTFLIYLLLNRINKR